MRDTRCKDDATKDKAGLIHSLAHLPTIIIVGGAIATVTWASFLLWLAWEVLVAVLH